MTQTHTRTVQQTACDGVRLAWRSLPNKGDGGACIAPSVDGIVRENNHVVLRTYAQRHAVSRTLSSRGVVPLPLIQRVAYGMAGVRVPRPKHQIQLHPFPVQK
jgi:hypothetical protein